MPQMTPKQFTKWLQNYPARLGKEVARAEVANLRKAKSVALKLSSGTVKARRLRLMGHPYAKGFAGSAPADPSIINRQSGLFKSSWKTQPPSILLNGQAIISKLINTAPYAVFLDSGTRKMVQRPFVRKIIHDTQASRLKGLQDAINRAWGL